MKKMFESLVERAENIIATDFGLLFGVIIASMGLFLLVRGSRKRRDLARKIVSLSLLAGGIYIAGLNLGFIR